MILELEEVTRRFGEVTAVDRLSFGLAAGEFVTLLGPSGCGKTTALRLIAGFDRPDAGAVRFRDRDVSDASPQDRGFGMVFQNYALFPHLDVFENVAFGLRSRGVRKVQLRDRVGAALDRVDLAGYGSRAVQALSGGQQQRVALARALAIEPPLLLLDEPLSNLDQALRVQTRAELRRLVKELGITALFVTHDQEEAFDLSDRIAVMRAGRLCQIGSPRSLYEEPEDAFVAAFMGRANLLPVTGGADDGDGAWVRLPGGARQRIPVEGLPTGRTPRPGSTWRGRLLVRPEGLRFVSETNGGIWTGRVRERRFRGALTLYRVETEDAGELEVSHAGRGPNPGEPVHVGVRPDAKLRVLPADPGEEEGPSGRTERPPDDPERVG